MVFRGLHVHHRVASRDGLDVSFEKCSVLVRLKLRIGHQARLVNISGFQSSPVNDGSSSCPMSQVSSHIMYFVVQRLTASAWSTLLGWQCGNASGLFLTGSLFQSMITIYRPDNGQYMWQTVVFIFPCLILVVVVNIYGTRTIAVMQNIVMSFHILALIAIIGQLNPGYAQVANSNRIQAILGVLSPHIPVKRALFQIENTDWPSAALAVFFGQTNANYSLFCECCGTSDTRRANVDRC